MLALSSIHYALSSSTDRRFVSPIADAALSEDHAKLVKERCDIVELIGSYVNLQKAGRFYKGLCPFHEDHRPSFQVNPDRQSWVCWPCNLRGDAFTFIMKTPPASDLLKKAAGIIKGSGVPQKDKVGKITQAQLREIAQKKQSDLNAADLEGAIKIIAGTARSMGVVVQG